MKSISVSEIQRNLHKLDGFDIVEIVDKKRNQLKGYFLDSSYQSLIESLIHQKEQKKSNLLKVVGIISDGDEITKEQLREERLSKYE